MTDMNNSTASAILLGIEKSIRKAPDMTALQFVAVTETRRLISFQQAILFARGLDGKQRVVAVSNVPSVDRNAPFAQFVERLINAFPGDQAQQVLNREEHGAAHDAEWQEFLPDTILCQPILAPNGAILGMWMFVRNPVWTDGEKLLVGQLSETLGHAWNALRPHKKHNAFFADPKRRRLTLLGVLVVLLIVLALPVRQSVIAPATVNPRNPVTIAAPLSGVIRDVAVRPNASVQKGDLLFAFEDAEFRANYEIALRAVATAEAQLRRASQQAFGDAKGRAEVALQQTRLELRKEQAAFSAYQLSQMEVRAPQEGIAIFADANAWRGRPVSTGEQIMSIATPDEAELGISIPVSDAIALDNGAEVRLFLDTDPLNAIDAKLEYASYTPQETVEGVLAYNAVAQFDESETVPRIGLKGSAKILGERVPLVLFIFRRPLTALRQMVGF